MKNTLLAALALMAAPAALADIIVTFDSVPSSKEYNYEYAYIMDMVKPRSERPAPVRNAAALKDNKLSIATPADGAAQVVLVMPDNQYIPVYTAPGDVMTISVSSESPLKYSVKGSKLMEDIARLDSEATAINAEARALMTDGGTPAALQLLEKRYNDLFKNYIAQNPKSTAVPFAIMNLSGQDFIDAFDAMTAEAKASPLFPVLEQQRVYVERQIEADRKKAQLSSGTVEAPDFTLPDVSGKQVSLSQFRGKWVVIDFWGSWCPWCIKGFPALKEAYKKYAGKLEVVGVDCNDPMDAWKKALTKYELPWVNVYNAEQNGPQLLESYGVEGFPTKVIVNPEGKIVNITSGENPAFFDVLDSLINKVSK